MAGEVKRIERQIGVLEDFETKCRAYLADFEQGQGLEEWVDAGGPADVLDEDTGWSAEESAAHKRELSELAPAVDRAMRDSGVGVPALGRPRAQGGGPMAASLPAMIFYHGPIELDESGTAMQRRLLELIPAAVGGLKMQLEEERRSGAGGVGGGPVGAEPALAQGRVRQAEVPAPGDRLHRRPGRFRRGGLRDREIHPPLVSFGRDRRRSPDAACAHRRRPDRIRGGRQPFRRATDRRARPLRHIRPAPSHSRRPGPSHLLYVASAPP
jgi:hypothetical protein